ncbi:hypothetical protein [Ilumatobacter nonamiensis]|uniref:hypothetical protein n=1 Tax=Ilumatobacter nonamiensis TaxID=467093 RepID=UPI00034DE216|nr:hypothetical protein [Ilumatobacter nonamiensis]
MNTTPSVDQILEGLIMALDDEILPALTNPKAYATAQMMQSLIQSLRQTLPVLDEQLVEEHNDMIRTLADAAAALGDASGDAADRVRDRGATFGQLDKLPAPLDRDVVIEAHTALGRAIEATFPDLDELQRAGVASADDALQIIRAHLGPRYVRDAQTIVVGAGFVGRG